MASRLLILLNVQHQWLLVPSCSNLLLNHKKASLEGLKMEHSYSFLSAIVLHGLSFPFPLLVEASAHPDGDADGVALMTVRHAFDCKASQSKQQFELLHKTSRCQILSRPEM